MDWRALPLPLVWIADSLATGVFRAYDAAMNKLIAAAALSLLATAATGREKTPEQFLYGSSTPVAGAATSQDTYRAAVSAADPRAAAAGRWILAQGGSAADAAMAVMIALTVVEPQSSGIGGGGFLLYHDVRKGLVSYDGREKAPAAATPDYWLGADGKPIGIQQAVPGGRSVGVPGNLALAAKVHARHGKLRWAQLFEPAIILARDGFTISTRMRTILEGREAFLAENPTARALYYGPDGDALAVGTVVRNPALAATLTDLARHGPRIFYKGPYGKRLVAAARGAARNPSLLTEADMAAYRVEVRQPVCGSYRVYRVCGMAPPSSGGVGVFAVLKQIERFDIAGLGKDSPVAWHLIAESMRLAYADRAQFIADPTFVAVPTTGLVSDSYLAGRSALISADKAMASVAAGNPDAAPKLAVVPDTEVAGTSDFAVADSDGNVASMTSTIESVFGSGLMVDGYTLNNELTDFNFVPAVGGTPSANRVEGGKRPRSTMSPAIVYGPDGKVVVAVGAAGGGTILAQVAKALIGVLDWKLTLQQAIALPQIMGTGNDVRVEKGSALEAMAPALTALGHNVIVGGFPLKANGVQSVAGGWTGGADPRSEGVVVGIK